MDKLHHKILVSDFDGTMTKHDFFRLALTYLPPESAEPWARYERGLTSHFDALQEIFSGLQILDRELDELLSDMQIEHGLSKQCERLQAGGWSLVIASAGCAFYIERILRRIGGNAIIYANPGEFVPEIGLFMKRPLHSQFYHPETGIDKSAIVKQFLDSGCTTAFAGDGRPDLAPALLVEPKYRFAKGWLADELERLAVPFIRFEHWGEIVDILCLEVE
jgi:2-hydroxy-3-keto-5-methylthiopentenyl-1-phosphate phosphatase